MAQPRWRVRQPAPRVRIMGIAVQHPGRLERWARRAVRPARSPPRLRTPYPDSHQPLRARRATESVRSRGWASRRAARMRPWNRWGRGPGGQTGWQWLRFVGNFVNLTHLVGLAVALIGRASIQRGPRGLIPRRGLPLKFPVAGAFTIGNVHHHRQHLGQEAAGIPTCSSTRRATPGSTSTASACLLPPVRDLHGLVGAAHRRPRGTELLRAAGRAGHRRLRSTFR